MSARRFLRKPKKKPQLPRFLIVSEGFVTERDYFEAWRRLLRIPTTTLDFKPPPPTSPEDIVRKAKEIRDLAERSDPYDEVWCLFDTETGVKQQGRDGLADAMALAEQWNIDVAVSNPCFELWVLIHEENVQAWIDSHVCQARCVARLLVKNKALLDAGSLLGRFSEAKARAIALEEKHDRDANFAIKERNPSTRVFILVTAILNRYTGGSSASSEFTK